MELLLLFPVYVALRRWERYARRNMTMPYRPRLVPLWYWFYRGIAGTGPDGGSSYADRE